MNFSRPTFSIAKLTVGSVDVSGSSAILSQKILEIKKEPSPGTRNLLGGEGNNEKPTIKSTAIAFWLQRKLGHTSSSRNVIDRLGYRLRLRKRSCSEDGPASIERKTNQNAQQQWELDTDDLGQPILARVHILVPNGDSKQQDKGLWNELGALQRMAQHQNQSSGHAHVVGSNIMAQDPETKTIYAVLPYHNDGTLLQFCQSSGSLPEPMARFLFRQILMGLKTLKSAGVCHRNLSLDTIAMDGDRVDIVGLGWALPCNNSRETKKRSRDGAAEFEAVGKNNTTFSSSFPPTPGGSDPRFIPPESFYDPSSGEEENSAGDDHHRSRVWDGFREDLWAAGLILYSMVVGTDALFAAPIAGDQRFKRLCLLGDVRGEAQRFGSNPSDELVELLQSMLHAADPNKRPTLEQVLQDPWVTRDDDSDSNLTPTTFRSTSTSGKDLPNRHPAFAV